MKKLLLLLFFAGPLYASQIMNPATAGGGGGGSGGYNLQPASVTIQGNVGVDMSTGTVQTEAIISTGIPNLGQVNNITFPNIATNPDFETWRSGTGILNGLCANTFPLTPNQADNWTVYLGCALTSPAGDERVTSPVKFGTYSLQLQSGNTLTSGTGFYIQQLIPNPSEFYGSSVTLSVWIETTSNPTSASIGASIFDGVTASTSTLTTGAAGTWQQYTVTHFMSASSTQLLVRIGALTSAGHNMIMYIDGVSLVRGDVPTDYSPPNYSATMSQIQTDPVGGIVGTPTNDSATAGDVGEYVATASASGGTTTNFPTSGTIGDFLSISLTAGDWDVSIIGEMTNTTATAISDVFLGISTTVGNSFTGVTVGVSRLYYSAYPASAGATYFSFTIPSVRISLNATTAVNFKYGATYATAPLAIRGGISARRVR